jgi:hypothetical protein
MAIDRDVVRQLGSPPVPRVLAQKKASTVLSFGERQLGRGLCRLVGWYIDLGGQAWSPKWV